MPQTTAAIDETLAGFQERRAALTRDRSVLEARLADAREALASAVARGGQGGVLAKLRTDLRELHEEHDGVVAALDLLERDGGRLAEERSGVALAEARAAFDAADDQAVAAIERIRDVVEETVVPLLRKRLVPAIEGELAAGRTLALAGDALRRLHEPVPEPTRRERTWAGYHDRELGAFVRILGRYAERAGAP